MKFDNLTQLWVNAWKRAKLFSGSIVVRPNFKIKRELTALRTFFFVWCSGVLLSGVAWDEEMRAIN